MRKRLTLPDEVCEKQETNKKMIRNLPLSVFVSFWLIVLSLRRCARVLERIVNQNNFSDIALGLMSQNETTFPSVQTFGSTKTKRTQSGKLRRAQSFLFGSFYLRKSVKKQFTSIRTNKQLIYI